MLCSELGLHPSFPTTSEEKPGARALLMQHNSSLHHATAAWDVCAKRKSSGHRFWGLWAALALETQAERFAEREDGLEAMKWPFQEPGCLAALPDGFSFFEKLARATNSREPRMAWAAWKACVWSQGCCSAARGKGGEHRELYHVLLTLIERR